MNEIYTKLMKQQSLSQEAKAEFYEKLEHAHTRRRVDPVLRTAVIAACVLLLIPVTILAVENIFGVVVINRVEQATVRNQPGVGLDIRFDNVKNHPITDFSKRLQTLKKSQVVGYESWEEAEKDLGMDLLSNSICTDGKTARIGQYTGKGNPPGKHCEGIYSCVDSQLCHARIAAAYQRGPVKFVVGAEITAEHPTVTDERLKQYHGTSIAYFEKYDPNVTTEQYVTKSGIPVTICTVDLGDMAEHTAYFAVNDISYGVRIIGCEGSWDDSAIYGVLCEILEGFTF